MRRIVPGALAVLALTTPAAGERPTKRFVGATFATDINLPVRSMAELKFVGVVRQRYDFSCGSAALATLLRMYGGRLDEAATFKGMWADGDQAQIRRLGFSLLDMQRFLNARGVKANGYRVTLKQIEETGVPGVALIAPRGYRHFVVVQGVQNGDVLVADPALGLRVERAETFQKEWNGVYFVLDSHVDRGKQAFNRIARWAAYPRSPLSNRFADPLSIQALQVARPGFGEF